MKVKQLILATILFTGCHLCFAQDDNAGAEVKPIKFRATSINSTSPQPLFVLKASEKTLEFDPAKNEKPDLESIDSKWIETITVLKGDDAKNKYGDRGLNGVIVIVFKDLYLLSKELQTKFEAIK